MSLQTAVDAFAVERAEAEWVEARKAMAAMARNSASSSPRRTSSDAEDVEPCSMLSSFEPALHEFAPPELSREARATAVRNALRGGASSGGGGGEGEGGGTATPAAALAVAAAVADEGARLSAAALLKALCRGVGGQLAASVVVAALRLEGEVLEADGDSDGEEEEEAEGREEKEESAAAVETFERDLEGSGRGSGRRLLARVLPGSGRNLAARGEAENVAATPAAAACSSSKREEKKEEEKKRQPRPQPPPPSPRAFSVLRRGWCDLDGARRCYYFES